MLTVQILEDHDTILPTDWCRPLQLVTMSGGHSDDYSFESVYSGQPENNVKWVAAGQIFGKCWMGKTVGTIHSAMEHCGGPYEFVRGEIPKAHWYGPTKRELRQKYEAYLECTIVPHGKHKGKSWAEVQKHHSEYFEWAVGAEFVKSAKDFGCT